MIHSFWIPALGGKMDMIPGRSTRLTLDPTRTGTFRGVCAEYCGTSHALMAFRRRGHGESGLRALARAAATPAPATRRAARGARTRLFSCQRLLRLSRHPRHRRPMACSVPDLTHVGSRLSLGAGILPNERERFHALDRATPTK